jgi:hypothetical protein
LLQNAPLKTLLLPEMCSASQAVVDFAKRSAGPPPTVVVKVVVLLVVLVVPGSVVPVIVVPLITVPGSVVPGITVVPVWVSAAAVPTARADTLNVLPRPITAVKNAETGCLSRTSTIWSLP